MPTFTYQGRRIGYAEYGSGPRIIVLIHSLLMDGRMCTKLAPMLAAHGHRVITADMLGHGTSDQPHVMTEYSMPQFGRDALSVLDHLDRLRDDLTAPFDELRAAAAQGAAPDAAQLPPEARAAQAMRD